ncbi:Dynein heavy chain [Giardia muris]|uniref:Dynein heavy chain n=1 Tax=Giardia muris TaxID=5742 RepID=A0A4Z1SMF8_GIAMU|nr:Dynein heavy chain [Giardia muris]|eukprot:TNJ26760.1 Dynein heavy chain [Giardia muris]
MPDPSSSSQGPADILRARLYANSLSGPELYSTGTAAGPQSSSQSSGASIPPPPNATLPHRVKTQRGWKFLSATAPGADHYSQLHAAQQHAAPPIKQAKPETRVLGTTPARARPAVTDLMHPTDAAKMLRDSPPGSFLYMSRYGCIRFPPSYIAGGTTYHDWDVLVCPNDWTSPDDYYTLSSQGVTHFTGGVSHFTELEEWLYNLVMLQKLRRIPIFTNFRRWKALRLLKKAVIKNRRTRAYNYLSKNLFCLNPILFAAIQTVGLCCDKIRSFRLIITDQDVERARLQVQKARSQALGDLDTSRPGTSEGVVPEQWLVSTMLGVGSDSIGYAYPFSLSGFETMYVARCRDLAVSLDAVVTYVAIHIREAITGVIVSTFGTDRGTDDDNQGGARFDFEEFDTHRGSLTRTMTMTAAESTAFQARREGKVTYTERAARLNLCKRMVSFLRMADFMIMDGLYDLAYANLCALNGRLQLAGTLNFPGYEEAVPTMEFLREQERLGIIHFGPVEDEEEVFGETPTPAGDVDSAKELINHVGDDSAVTFMGRVVCLSSPDLAQLNPRAGEDAPGLGSFGYSRGFRSLANLDDPQTPGAVILPGQIATLALAPSFEEFYKAFETMVESVLSVETAVRRLVAHEDFADVTSPFTAGGILANATSGGDGGDGTGGDDIAAPDLSALFSNNPLFHNVLTSIAHQLRTEYDSALDWMKNLQAYFDAYNDIISLNVDAIDESFLVLPQGLTDLMSVSVPDILANIFDYGVALGLRKPPSDTAPRGGYLDGGALGDFLGAQKEKPTDPLYRYDIKAAFLQIPPLAVQSRRDIPLTSYQGMTRAALTERLYQHERIIQLITRLEEYRLLLYAMPLRVNLGAFAFDLTELHDAFAPAPQRVLDYLHQLIPLACYRRITILLLNMAQIQSFLTRTSQSVEEFITYKDCLSLITEEVLDNARLISGNVFQLAQTLRDNHGVFFPPEFSTVQTLFSQYFEQLRNTILSSEQLVDQQLNMWVGLLNDKGTEISADLAKLAYNATDPTLNRAVELCSLEEVAAVVYDYITFFEKDESANPQQPSSTAPPGSVAQTPLATEQTDTPDPEPDTGTGAEIGTEDDKTSEAYAPTLADRLLVLTLEYIINDVQNQSLGQTDLQQTRPLEIEPDVGDLQLTTVTESNLGDTIHQDPAASTLDASEVAVDNLTMESGALGRTQELSRADLASIMRSMPPAQFSPTSRQRLVNSAIQLKERAEQTGALRQRLTEIEAAIRTNQKYQTFLNIEVMAFPTLEETSQLIKLYDNFWSTCYLWLSNMVVFLRSFFFGQLDLDYMAKFVADSGKIAFQCERQLSSVDIVVLFKLRVNEFRQLLPVVQSLDNANLRPRHWADVGKALDVEIPRFGEDARNPIHVTRQLYFTEKERERAAPEDLVPKHSTVTLQEDTPMITIAWLVHNDAMAYRDELSAVSNIAANEASLEVGFRKLESEWAKIEISTTNYKDSLDIFVLTDVADFVTKLDDSILVLSGIVSSRYVKPIQDDVNRLYTQLTQLSSTIDVWCNVQKGYLYLLNIFGSGDIQRQLPNETKLFLELDGFWKKLLARAQDYPKAVDVPQFNLIGTAVAAAPGNMAPLESSLRRYEQILDSIQKSLDEYLQNKRMSFARLYFLSDEELLDILSQSKNPHAIQGHIRKIFDAIQSVEFTVGQSGGLDITAMLSEEGERVAFTIPIKARGSVTAWLGNLEQRMRQTINKHCRAAVEDYSIERRSEWILDHPAQCIICASQIFWCEGIHLALDSEGYAGYGGTRVSERGIDLGVDTDTAHGKKGADKNPLALYAAAFERILMGLIRLIQNPNLTKLQRCTVTALATIDVHSRDTLYDLVQARVTSVTSFEFQKLLRYYWNASDNHVHIHQSAAHFVYGCEYLGASPRLVITPLTDLCYLTLMIAHRFYLGGAPQGPAGTGKTETTKDLAKALAMPCIVFNCSESLDYRIMGRFFAGLSQVGAWICFDEFNRIDLEVLSVVASQVLCIQNAVKAGQERFIFEGVDMPLNKTVGIFITMNPGYAGRVELPDNLKALFRAVSMVVPDYSLIAEIILFSEGFTTAKVLSRKMVQLYKLSSEQLSQQDHYDFGMRAIKSVLVMAGGLRRKYEHLSEDVVLIRAMRDANVPKFTAADIELFMGIVQDLFPGVQIPSVEHGDLALCIETVLRRKNLYPIPLQVAKIVQLHETMQVRHGVMQVGGAKLGKTVCMRVLQEALGLLRDKVEREYSPEARAAFFKANPDHVVNHVRLETLNPKSIDMAELYGSYNDVSGEWKDGLVGVLIRDMLAKTTSGLKDEQTGLPLPRHKQWLVFDGPVDTLWIESLNTLLDDNKLICFANSERLKINEYISIVFEVENLRNASPATVSRAGMVYFSQPQGLAYARDLSACMVRWDAYVICWLRGEFDQRVRMVSGLREVGYGPFRDDASPSDPHITPDASVLAPKDCEKNLEAMLYDHFRRLILKLFSIFIPVGLEFCAKNSGSLLIPTTDFSLVQSVTRIFVAVLTYNRSMIARERAQRQMELDKAAEENGYAEVPQANDPAQMELVDFTLFARFLTLQFVTNNGSLMIQSSLTDQQKLAKLLEYILASDEFAVCESIIKSAFIYSFIWSFACCAMLTPARREEFDNMVRTLIETNNEKFIAFKATGNVPDGESGESSLSTQRPFAEYDLPAFISLPAIPNSGLVFDYYVDWSPVIEYQQKMLSLISFMPALYYIEKDDNTAAMREAQLKNGVYQATTDLFSDKAVRISGLLNANDEAMAFLNARVLTTQTSCVFSSFDGVISKFTYDPKVPFFQIYVNTLDSVRHSHLIESLIKQRKPVLVTGNTGSGKSVMVMDLLASLDRRGLVQNIFINFSAASNSLRTQEMIEASLDKRRKNVLGPVMGRIACIFVDDINMIAYDLFGSQQAVEFVRDLADTDGFYDRKDWFFKSLADTSLISACAPAGGGRNVMSTRTVGHFVNIALPNASDEVLQSIFNSILSGHLSYADTSDPQAQAVRFSVDVVSLGASAVRALIQIYQGLSSKLRPTPSKLHYTFNLRDVSKVIQGMLRATPATVRTANDFASLFRHECLRVFADRTVTDEDRDVVYDTVIDVLGTTPGLANTAAAKKPSGGNSDGVDERPEDIWGNYMRPGTPVEMRVYERGQSSNAVKQVFDGYLSEYNNAGSKQTLNLVLFKEAVEHVSRISRTITAPRGSLLLVGFGGSGRKSLTRLAAFLCDCELVTIELRKGYGLSDFREDLKVLFQKTGVGNKSVVFMLDDSQILVESQLEDVNNLLNSGVVPNLFESDELDKIMSDIRGIINKEALPVDVGNKDAVFRFFINRVRDNLHIVLCLSPSGDKFRNRLRTFPSLVTNLTIDWFKNWPAAALIDVARGTLVGELLEVNIAECYDVSAESDLGKALQGLREEADSKGKEFDEQLERARLLAKQLTEKISPIASEVHDSVEKMLVKYHEETRRRHYVPPACYLELLSLYSSLLSQRIEEISKRYYQLTTGVEKLIESKAQVETLQKEQEALAPELEVAATNSAKLITQLESEKKTVDSLREVALSEETIVKAQAQDTEIIAQDAQRDLDAAMPLLIAANKALDSLNSSDITEIKSFKQPPALVKMVMEAICILVGSKPDWDSAKKVLGDTGFLKSLINYDKDHVPDATLKALKKYTTLPEFVPEKVEKQSLAAKSLCFWAIAIEKYAYTIREVEPKRKRLEGAKADLKEKMDALAEKQAKLKEVEDKLAALEATFTAQNNEKLRLEQAMELTKARLSRATQLTSALSDERERWVVQSKALKEQLRLVPGDVFLATCSVAYLGVFNAKYRSELLSFWHGLLEAYGIECTPLETVLRDGIFPLITSDDMLLEMWRSQGLPSDLTSTNNAVMVTATRRFPLIMDPQGQALTWIKGMEKENDLVVLKPAQTGLLRIFENCVRTGTPVVLDGVTETIEPSLKPIIEREVIMSAGKPIIMLNDNEVEWHPRFRLYLITKLASPSFSPEVHAKLNLVNFTISTDALEDQLLQAVVSAEYPSLEQKRIELTTESSQNRQRLAQLSDQILHELTSFKGSVLDNENLIRVLSESKTVAADIEVKERQAVTTRAEIARYYAFYRPLSVRCALIYFIVSDMSLVEPMYLFALGYYIRLFVMAVQAVPEYKEDPDHMKDRVDLLITRVTYAIFSNISRGVFEKDKLVFAFLLAARILQIQGDILPDEWSIFSRGVLFAGIILSDASRVNAMSKPLRDVFDTLEREGEAYFEGAQAASKMVTLLKALTLIPSQATTCQFIAEHHTELLHIFKETKDGDALCRDLLFWRDCEIVRLFGTGERLNPISTLILIKIFSDDLLILAIPLFVEFVLGPEYSVIEPPKLTEIYADSTSTVPVIFLLTTGADPLSQLQALAQQCGQPLNLISLGQGQAPIARAALEKASSTGGWVFLQNGHLARSWMAELEQIVEALSLCETMSLEARKEANTALPFLTLPPKPSFRLFISSMPVRHFPASVLQTSLKVTTEPPTGLRNNVVRLIGTTSVDTWEAGPVIKDLAFEEMIPKPAEGEEPPVINEQAMEIFKNAVTTKVRAVWKRLFYALVFFHGILLERRKFGPQAFNVRYEFNESDYAICLQSLQSFMTTSINEFLMRYGADSVLNNSGEIVSEAFVGGSELFFTLPWDAITFIFAKIHYGGRVTDSWDQRTLSCIFTGLMNEKVSLNLDEAHDFIPANKKYTISFTADTQYEELVSFTQALPMLDGTDVFDMSENSLVVFRQMESTRVIARVLDISMECLPKSTKLETENVDETTKTEAQEDNRSITAPTVTLQEQIDALRLKLYGEPSTELTTDQIVDNIAASLLEKLPPSLDVEKEAGPNTFIVASNGMMHCLSVVLSQEIERFNNLLRFLRSSLESIRLAIKGLVLLSVSLEEQYHSIALGRVPDSWTKLAYPSLKPLVSWFDDLIKRVAFMRNWLVGGTPTAFWMSGLYFPQGFITGVLQMHAREHQISIDSLTFDFSYLQQFDVVEKGEDGGSHDESLAITAGVLIYGLYLDCGYFDVDSSRLIPARPGILYPRLPIIHFKPVTVDSKITPGYNAPIYKTSERAGILSSTGRSTNHIMPVIIPTEEDPTFFIRQGCAVLCQLND